MSAEPSSPSPFLRRKRGSICLVQARVELNEPLTSSFLRQNVLPTQPTASVVLITGNAAQTSKSSPAEVAARLQVEGVKRRARDVRLGRQGVRLSRRVPAACRVAVMYVYRRRSTAHARRQWNGRRPAIGPYQSAYCRS